MIQPPAHLRRLWRALWPFLLWPCAVAWASASLGPVGTVTAVATQSRQYSSTVEVAYLEPVNCTLEFDEDIDHFGVHVFERAMDTRIFNLEELTKSKYTFQVASDLNANVTFYILPGRVRNTAGVSNNETTAFFNFHFYAYPPSATIRLDGFLAQSTNKVANLAYLVFNSTTTYDGLSHFNESLVSISPAYAITQFHQVSDDTYRFNFVVKQNETAKAAEVECLTPTEAAAVSYDGFVDFRCYKCGFPKLCRSETTYPPKDVRYLEFPMEVALEPVHALGLKRTVLPLLYDTLWPEVSIDAPSFARGPFFLTVTWTEPMSDPVGVMPSYGADGPPVDQQGLTQNLTVLGPTSYRLIVTPLQTGLLTIYINGTQDSQDLAGNTNDFRRNPFARTSAETLVVFSAGPPIAGTITTTYERPPANFEFQAPAFLSLLTAPVLAVSWAGFSTATRYDMWITWGKNFSTPLTSLSGRLLGVATCGASFENCTDSHNITSFTAMLGVEYTVYVRAYNIWGDQTTVSSVFLHPELSINADGSYKVVRLPDLLSQEETPVFFQLVVPQHGFLFMNPLKVLSFRTPDRAAGDQDPCQANTEKRRCTTLNFLIEVPEFQFSVFREPIKLHFDFGRRGWTQQFFQPKLFYWERYSEEWREAAATCDASKAYEVWDDTNKIYGVSFCHLTQFAVFEVLKPTVAPTTVAPPERPESSLDPLFFVALTGAVLVIACICCCWYWACIRPSVVKRTGPFDFQRFGIRPMSQRLPASKRRVDIAERVDVSSGHAPRIQDQQEHSRLLALPPGEPQVPPPLPPDPNSRVGGQAPEEELLAIGGGSMEVQSVVTEQSERVDRGQSLGAESRGSALRGEAEAASMYAESIHSGEGAGQQRVPFAANILPAVPIGWGENAPPAPRQGLPGFAGSDDDEAPPPPLRTQQAQQSDARGAGSEPTVVTAGTAARAGSGSSPPHSNSPQRQSPAREADAPGAPDPRSGEQKWTLDLARMASGLSLPPPSQPPLPPLASQPSMQSNNSDQTGEEEEMDLPGAMPRGVSVDFDEEV